MKLDFAAAWFKAPTVWAFAVLLVSATAVFLRMDFAITQLQNGQDTVVKSIGDMRDDMRKLVSDQVAVRQANSWLDLFRALNKDKFPTLVVPDLPR